MHAASLSTKIEIICEGKPCWELEVGSWKLEVGGWKLEVGGIEQFIITQQCFIWALQNLKP
jgi:hypothetical protein